MHQRPSKPLLATVKKAIRRMLFALAAVALVVFASLALQIDDWSRDLTTNEASTSETAADALLRPRRIRRPRDEVVGLLERAAERLRGWTFEGKRHVAAKAEDHTGDTVELKFVRETRLFRFKDDITLRVSGVVDADGNRLSIVTGHSQSRVGKGDLGQNPRNLREILTALDAQLVP